MARKNNKTSHGDIPSAPTLSDRDSREFIRGGLPYRVYRRDGGRARTFRNLANAQRYAEECFYAMRDGIGDVRPVEVYAGSGMNFRTLGAYGMFSGALCWRDADSEWRPTNLKGDNEKGALQ